MNGDSGFAETNCNARFNVTLVGGGLQGSLLLLSILQEHPDARVAMVDPGGAGASHTWCLHERDVPERARAWFEALVVARHSSYDVHFPRLHRRVDEPYLAVTSERLSEVVASAKARAPGVTSFRARASKVTAASVVLEDGRVVASDLVVDARGPERLLGSAQQVQKFVGLELLVEPGDVPATPVLMDATVEQRDGFRFLYVLPLGPARVLVEDTYYSENPSLDEPGLESGLLREAAKRGMKVKAVVRKERGILPLPLRPPRLQRGGALLAGYAGGYFHPTTGYSFPFALRFAVLVAQRAGALDGGRLAALQRGLRSQQRYACWLNWLLFSAFAPEQRFAVLERFYRLPADTIRRFYSLETTPMDRARILCGRPPHGFSLHKLVTSAFETRGPSP